MDLLKENCKIGNLSTESRKGKKNEVFQVGGKCTRLKSEARVVQVQVDVKDSDIVVVKRYETYYKAWKDPWNYAQQSRV